MKTRCLAVRPPLSEIGETCHRIAVETAAPCQPAIVQVRDGPFPKCGGGQVVTADTGDHPASLVDLGRFVRDKYESALPRHYPAEVGRQIRAQLEVQGPGQVPVGVFPTLAKVDDPLGASNRIAEGVGVKIGDGLETGAAGPLRFKGAM